MNADVATGSGAAEVLGLDVLDEVHRRGPKLGTCPLTGTTPSVVIGNLWAPAHLCGPIAARSESSRLARKCRYVRDLPRIVWHRVGLEGSPSAISAGLSEPY
jgi:hypothetical protein